MKPVVGIIGFGPFGQFVLKHLSPYFDVKVTSRTKREALARELGGEFVSLTRLLDTSQIVILSVAIPIIPTLIDEIKDRLKSNTLVLDVASVKIYPTNIMRSLLPKDVEVLGTHPLFGPQSGKEGIKGLKIVLTPVRIRDERLNKVIDFLQKVLELEVFVMSPEEHDKAMSRTQVITQYIARILKGLDIGEEELSLPSYELLLKLYKMLGEDSDTLFESIQLYNPYAVSVRDRLKNICVNIWKDLKEREDIHKKDGFF